jgi:hypothetical protein
MMSACNPDRLPASASPGSGSSATSATTFATSTSASGPGRFRGAGGRAGLDGPGHGVGQVPPAPCLRPICVWVPYAMPATSWVTSCQVRRFRCVRSIGFSVAPALCSGVGWFRIAPDLCLGSGLPDLYFLRRLFLCPMRRHTRCTRYARHHARGTRDATQPGVQPLPSSTTNRIPGAPGCFDDLFCF